MKQARLVDKAHRLIHGGQWAVTGKKVEGLVKEESLVPVKNAIATALSSLGFKLIPCLVSDILHEFEIGVWKNLFIHLVRILATQGPAIRPRLDYRYRATPTFGRETIRKFNANASEMSRKAARDYEDLLQCAIPAFEGLLPDPDNTHLMTLLYICAQWHALAKLRLHNDFTVDLLEYTTVLLGAQMRHFDREVCSRYSTKELPKEVEARVRRAAKKGKSASSSSQSASLGVFTIKFHLLGDYCDIIRMFGTTDSFSTELGELFHRQPKSWYPHTDRKDYEGQFTEMERRVAHIARIWAALENQGSAQKHDSKQVTDALPGNAGTETKQAGPEHLHPLQSHPPKRPKAALLAKSRLESDTDSHYIIGYNQNHPIHLSLFQELPDPGYTRGYFSEFVTNLKIHLLPRILSLKGYQASALDKCNSANVVFQNDRVYRHRTMRVSYATYDARRDEDMLNTENKCNLMVLNGSWAAGTKEPPYLYAKALGIFHTNAAFVGILPDGKVDHSYHRIDFIWIRWYDSLSHNDEFKLDRLALHALKDEALDFLDPSYIIRGIHVVPRFAEGKSKVLAPPSDLVNEKEVWKEYYINRFADRDLFMRYQYGMSIGHRYMYEPDFPPRAKIPSIPADFDYAVPTPSRPLTPMDVAEGSNVPSEPARSIEPSRSEGANPGREPEQCSGLPVHSNEVGGGEAFTPPVLGEPRSKTIRSTMERGSSSANSEGGEQPSGMGGGDGEDGEDKEGGEDGEDKEGGENEEDGEDEEDEEDEEHNYDSAGPGSSGDEEDLESDEETVGEDNESGADDSDDGYYNE